MPASSCSATTPLVRNTALCSQRKPKSSSNVPTTSCRIAIGTSASAGPNASTSIANSTAPARAPSNAERQPRVTPTASTIVSASTNSTTEARNAGRPADTACDQTTLYSFDDRMVAVPRRGACALLVCLGRESKDALQPPARPVAEGAGHVVALLALRGSSRDKRPAPHP